MNRQQMWFYMGILSGRITSVNVKQEGEYLDFKVDSVKQQNIQEEINRWILNWSEAQRFAEAEIGEFIFDTAIKANANAN